MFSRYVLIGCLQLTFSSAVCATEGWDGINPSRRPPDPVKLYWDAPLDKGTGAFDVERHDGAEGLVDFKHGKIYVSKTNERGWILVKSKARIKVREGVALRSFADAEVSEADHFHSVAFPRLLTASKSLTANWGLDAVGVHMIGGPRMGNLVCTPPNVPERRYASCMIRKNEDEAVPVLVIAGAPSKSVWHRWGIEDHDKAAEKWEKVLERPHGVEGRNSEGVSAREYMLRLACDVEHEAQVVRRDGAARLVVDGSSAPPVFYKINRGWSDEGFRSTGFFLEREGVKIQSVVLRAQKYWKNTTPNLAYAIQMTLEQMRLSPDAFFIVSIDITPPSAYSEDHSDEVWRLADGSPGYGDYFKMRLSRDGTPPKGCWPWISMFSDVWQRDMKRFMNAYVAELKRTGLSKRIVGFHLSGFHDGQFATYRPDYSPSAVRKFKAWMAERGSPVLGDVPRFPTTGEYFGSSPEDRLKRDFQIFQHTEPFRVLELFSRTLKAAFGKNVIAMHWSMDVMSGGGNGAYYMDEFVRSEAVDAIVSQPPYAQRAPGIALGEKIPAASFAHHGKLYIDEFDLRTYSAVGGYVRKELGTYGLSCARDFAEWLTIHRKMAGFAVAHRHGWWYFDIDSGFFEPPEIAADIGEVLKTAGKAFEANGHIDWEPSATFLLDEKGLLSRNISSGARHDERRLTEHQSFLLSASGVPYDVWLASDVLVNPELMAKRRIIVIAGFHELSDERIEFVKGQLSLGKTIVLLSGAGAAGGAEKLGFEPVFRPAPVSHEVESLTGCPEDFRSMFYADNLRWSLGVGVGPIAAHWRPSCFSFGNTSGFKPLARYRKGNVTSAISAYVGNGRLVVIGASCGLTASFFRKLAIESGAYVPADKEGLQVDMNGDFVSIHALRTDVFQFKLPFACEVMNLKSGKVEPQSAGRLVLDMTAGKTCWFRLDGTLR